MAPPLCGEEGMMFARKFLKHLEEHADHLTQELMQKLTRSGKCRELLTRVPAEEQKQSMRQIYEDMSKWLLQEKTYVNEVHYVALGMRRAQQGVPFSDLLAAVCAARQYFWEYIERETLLDAPSDFWGGMKLLYLLDSCLDSALYFASVGYDKAGAGTVVHMPLPVTHEVKVPRS